MKRLWWFVFNIYYSISSLPYLVGTSLGKGKKVAIFFKYIVGNILNQLCGLHSMRFQWLKIRSFDWATVMGLFGEVFLKNEYFFVAPQPEPVIIDCWANTGMTTIYYKRLYPKSTVYSFEPNKKAYSILQKNVKQNKLHNVHMFQQAVSDYSGNIDFFDTEDPSFTTGTIAWRSGEYTKTTVECIRFSDFLKDKKIDLLKMDIEWGEDAVMFDLQKTGMFGNIDEIILEYHHNIENQASNFSKILDILQEAWYTYSINAVAFWPHQTNKFQDMLIHAKKDKI